MFEWYIPMTKSVKPTKLVATEAEIRAAAVYVHFRPIRIRHLFLFVALFFSFFVRSKTSLKLVKLKKNEMLPSPSTNPKQTKKRIGAESSNAGFRCSGSVFTSTSSLLLQVPRSRLFNSRIPKSPSSPPPTHTDTHRNKSEKVPARVTRDGSQLGSS